MSEVSDMIEREIKIWARRLVRFAPDDHVELAKDLEVAGWIAYLENQDSDWVAQKVKQGMGAALCLWQRGVNYNSRRERERVPIRYTVEYQEGMLGDHSHSPEDHLIARESAISESAQRDTRNRKKKVKSVCVHGHALIGDNLLLVKCFKGGYAYTAQRCKACKNEADRRLYARKALNIINVLNLELQKEIVRHAEH